jgi:hypothetical protein
MHAGIVRRVAAWNQRLKGALSDRNRCCTAPVLAGLPGLQPEIVE